MSEGTKWTPGKILLLVVGILAGLGILCCGAGYLLLGDKIKAGIAFGTDSATFIQRLQKDYGKKAVFGIEKNDRAELILTIGAEGELTPERVAEVQDGAWRTFGQVFGKDGFFPIRHLAVGRPVSGHGKRNGNVVDWGKNLVSVEELVKRTGVPAPPLAAFLPADMDGAGGVEIKVTGGDDAKDEEESGGDTGGK